MPLIEQVCTRDSASHSTAPAFDGFSETGSPRGDGAPKARDASWWVWHNWWSTATYPGSDVVQTGLWLAWLYLMWLVSYEMALPPVDEAVEMMRQVPMPGAMQGVSEALLGPEDFPGSGPLKFGDSRLFREVTGGIARAGGVVAALAATCDELTSALSPWCGKLFRRLCAGCRRGIWEPLLRARGVVVAFVWSLQKDGCGRDDSENVMGAVSGALPAAQHFPGMPDVWFLIMNVVVTWLIVVLPDNGNTVLPYLGSLAAPAYVLRGYYWHFFVYVFVGVPLTDMFLVGNNLTNQARDSQRQLQLCNRFKWRNYAVVVVAAGVILLGAQRAGCLWREIESLLGDLSRSGTSWSNGGGRLLELATKLVGLSAAAGLHMGAISFTTAHEMVHRAGWLERACGKWMLCGVCYGHFYVEHTLGHHKLVGTDEDPATARYPFSSDQLDKPGSTGFFLDPEGWVLVSHSVLAPLRASRNAVDEIHSN